MVRANLIHAVIGLPDKMFAHTGIPVCIVILKKNRSEKDILFIDASKGFQKGTKQNVMLQEHIERIVSVYQGRRQEDKFSRRVDFKTLEENQFNLNIPRYVDTFEKEPAPDLCEVLSEIEKIDKEIKETEGQLFRMMNSMYGTNEKAEQELKNALEIFRRDISGKYGDSFLTNLGCFAIILLSDEGGQNDDPDNITTSRSAVSAPEGCCKTAGGISEQFDSDDFVE